VSVTYTPVNVCAGAPVTFTANPVNAGTGRVYQWKKNGINVGGNSITYSDNTLTATDTVYCILTSTPACGVLTALSNKVIVPVGTGTPPTISITGGKTCTSDPFAVFSFTGTFTATITNGGSAPSYQWKKNGSNVGGNSNTYTDNALMQGDVVACVLTSNTTCVPAAQRIVGSNAIAADYFMPVTPSITIATTSTDVCSTPATFTATITNGGSSPVFQWKKNGVNVGTNSSIYTDNGLVDKDVISCVLTSNVICAAPAQVGSNAYTVACASCSAPVFATVIGNGTPGFAPDGSVAVPGLTNYPGAMYQNI